MQKYVNTYLFIVSSLNHSNFTRVIPIHVFPSFTRLHFRLLGSRDKAIGLTRVATQNGWKKLFCELGLYSLSRSGVVGAFVDVFS
jgi:hypothetical protein